LSATTALLLRAAGSRLLDDGGWGVVGNGWKILLLLAWSDDRGVGGGGGAGWSLFAMIRLLLLLLLLVLFGNHDGGLIGSAVAAADFAETSRDCLLCPPDMGCSCAWVVTLGMTESRGWNWSNGSSSWVVNIGSEGNSSRWKRAGCSELVVAMVVGNSEFLRRGGEISGRRRISGGVV